MNEIGVLYCPNHWGFENQQKKRDKIKAALDDSKMNYDFIQSESADSVERLVTMMLNNGYKTIVIVGGDSAINDAVNCMMRLENDQRRDVRLGVIPNGVMNDFAWFWGLTKKDLQKSIDTIKKGRVRLVDIGLIRYTDKYNEQHHRYFINCVNIGLVAALQNLRKKTRSILGSRTLSYLSSAALLVTQRLTYKMHLQINNENLKQNIMTVCVGNTLGYGQTPSAVPYNGLLDVSLVSNPPLMQILSGLRLFLSKRFLMHHGVQPYRTKSVKVLAAPHAHVAVDGRLLPSIRGEYNITVQKELISFIIP